MARRVVRAPNAAADACGSTESNRGSRRSLDQRNKKKSRSLVVRLGCVLLLIGLVVSCTAFVLALVSFSASDTQHLQRQLDALRRKFDALGGDSSRESGEMEQELDASLRPIRQQVVSDSARVTELSRLYDALWLDVDHINVSLSTLKLLSADQQTLIKQCITKVQNIEIQLRSWMRRVIDVETENEGLKEMVELIRGEMKRYGASVDAQLAAFSLKLPVDCSATCSFTPFQSIPTDGAYDIESFTIGKQSYLAVANYGDISTGRHTTDSVIYRFNGHAFEVHQRLTTTGAYDVKPFEINRRHFLAVANHGDEETYNTKSLIYEWNSTHFVPFQFVQSHQASDIDAFEIGGKHFVAIANRFNGETYDVDVSILVWNSKRFVSFEQLDMTGASAIEHFTINHEAFLAIASYKSGPGQYRVSSRIYRWSQGRFVLHQDVNTIGAWDVKAFHIKRRHFLVFGCYFNGYTQQINSLVLKWDEKNREFITYQQLETRGVRHVDYVAINGRHLLFLASYRLGKSFNVQSTMYEFVNRTFVVAQTFTTMGATALKAVKLGTNVFLAALQSFDGVKSTITSEIYRYQ